MAAIELMAIKEQRSDVHARPEKLSFSRALTAVRHSSNNLTDCPEFLDDLYTGLRRALIDSYERKKLKSGRYKPKLKRNPHAANPISSSQQHTSGNAIEKFPYKMPPENRSTALTGPGTSMKAKVFNLALYSALKKLCCR